MPLCSIFSYILAFICGFTGYCIVGTECCTLKMKRRNNLYAFTRNQTECDIFINLNINIINRIGRIIGKCKMKVWIHKNLNQRYFTYQCPLLMPCSRFLRVNSTELFLWFWLIDAQMIINLLYDIKNEHPKNCAAAYVTLIEKMSAKTYISLPSRGWLVFKTTSVDE